MFYSRVLHTTSHQFHNLCVAVGVDLQSRKHVRTDGTKRRRLKRVLSDSSGDDEPQQKDNGHADERRQSGLAYEWVKKLTQMFPAFRASQVAMVSTRFLFVPTCTRPTVFEPFAR